jgi:hypothetical protein
MLFPVLKAAMTGTAFLIDCFSSLYQLHQLLFLSDFHFLEFAIQSGKVLLYYGLAPMLFYSFKPIACRSADYGNINL